MIRSRGWRRFRSGQYTRAPGAVHTMPANDQESGLRNDGGPERTPPHTETTMADESKAPFGLGETPAGEARQQQQQPMQIPVDTSDMAALYANFFRVTGTPEEIVLDFGLNTQLMTPTGPEAVKLNQRLVMSFYTAKRL